MSLASRIQVVTLALVSLLPQAAVGQAVVIVRSNDADAGVLIDSTWVGRASAGPFQVERGRHVVRVIPGLPGRWGVEPVTRVLDLADGDSVTVHAHFSVPNESDREGRLPHVAVAIAQPAQSRRTWIDYAAVSGALLAGAVAVHYKMKADGRYDVYRQTGDPTLRPEIRRLDTRSGIAVGVMQVGITIFAVRLVKR